MRFTIAVFISVALFLSVTSSVYAQCGTPNNCLRSIDAKIDDVGDDLDLVNTNLNVINANMIGVHSRLANIETALVSIDGNAAQLNANVGAILGQSYPSVTRVLTDPVTLQSNSFVLERSYTSGDRFLAGLLIIQILLTVGAMIFNSSRGLAQ